MPDVIEKEECKNNRCTQRRCSCISLQTCILDRNGLTFSVSTLLVFKQRSNSEGNDIAEMIFISAWYFSSPGQQNEQLDEIQCSVNQQILSKYIVEDFLYLREWFLTDFNVNRNYIQKFTWRLHIFTNSKSHITTDSSTCDSKGNHNDCHARK